MMRPQRPSTAMRETLMNVQHTQRQDQALEKAQERDFLQSIQTDPISIANKKVMDTQQQMLEEYRTKYSDLYRQRQGRLTTSDKVEMQSAKQAITAYQAQVQGDYDRYLQDVQRYTSSPSRYSSRNFEQGIKNYLEGDGTYQGGIVTPAATPWDDFVKKNRLQAQGGTNMKTSGMFIPSGFQPGAGGKGITTYNPVWTEDDAREYFYRAATTNDSDMQLVMELWDEASPEMRSMMIADTEDKNSRRQDETQKLNPALEYAFNQPEIKGSYLNPRKVEGSQQASMTPQSTTADLDLAVKTGSGPGIRENMGMRFGEQKGYSGEIGTNLDAMTFTFGTANMWQKLPVNFIEDAPEDIELAGEVVDAQVRAVADGKAEWIVRVPTYKEVKSTEARGSGSGLTSVKSGYTVQRVNDKNKYFKVDYKERSVVTPYQPVSGIINTEFPNVSAVIEDRGYNVPQERTETEDDEFSQYKR